MNFTIVNCRSVVDEIDGEIIVLLKRRFQMSRELAAIKKRLDLPVRDHERELSILERVSMMSCESPDCASVVAVFRQILEESRAVQLKARALDPPQATSSDPE